MTQWKRTATLIATAVAAVALLILGIVLSGTNHNASEKDNEMSLKRLDEISQRLSVIGTELEDIDGQLLQLEYQKDNLISEQTLLNEEAQGLFLGLVTPEFVEPIDESNECDGIGCDPNDGWEPGQLTEDGTNQVMPEVTAEDSHERFKQLANAYGLNPSTIREVENHYGLTEGLILCITIAETSGGKFGAGKGNIGNVGNNDRGDRVTFALAETGLEKIGQTLTNGYLGGHTTLGCLSNWHHCEEPNDNGKRYATSSPETSGAWEPNMVTCLDTIYGQGTTDPTTFNIRR